jgi:hypothetical protein
MLMVPEFHGVNENVAWHLALSATDAIHLARVREQHELAYAIRIERTPSSNSVLDIAVALETRYNTLQPKFKGWAQATENDLIRWTWLVGTERRSYRPRDLWSDRTELAGREQADVDPAFGPVQDQQGDGDSGEPVAAVGDQLTKKEQPEVAGP